MLGATTLNLNAAECLKSASHFGFERVHNICAGGFTDVPWGFMDYTGVALLCGLAIAGIAMMFGLFLMMASDVWGW